MKSLQYLCIEMIQATLLKDFLFDDTKPIPPEKFVFISCILSQFRLILESYFLFPEEIIRLILLNYYILETYIDISELDKYNRGRNRLFDYIWKFLKWFQWKNRKWNIISIHKTPYRLIELIKFTSNKGEDFFNLDLFKSNYIINIYHFDNFFGNHSFKYIFDISKDSVHRPTYIIRQEVHRPDSPKKDDEVLILDHFEVVAKGVITCFIDETAYRLKKTYINITKFYSIIIKYVKNGYITVPNRKHDFMLAYYSKSESKYIYWNEDNYNTRKLL